MKPTLLFLAAAVALTLVVGAVWVGTGAAGYTKFQIVEQVEVPVDTDDPLVAAGFFDQGATQRETVTRDAFQLGLLPTPEGVFDKHAVSVATLLGPVWAAAAGGVWWDLRWRRRGAGPAPAAEG